MPTITRVRGDRLKIRQCVREVTVASTEFEYPLQATGLLYTINTVGLTVSGVLNESPQTIQADNAISAVYVPDEDKIYYVVEADLFRTNVDGTGRETLGVYRTGTIVPYEIVLHPNNSQLVFWYKRSTAGGFDALYLQTLDFPISPVTGGDTQPMVTLFSTTDSNGSTGGVTYDIDRQVYYLANSGGGAGDGKIRKVNWDGTGHSIFLSGVTFEDGYAGIAYDPVEDKIYFIENGVTTRNEFLKQMNPDGTNIITIKDFGDTGTSLNDLAFSISGRFFTIPRETGAINLHSMEGEIVAELRAASPESIRFTSLMSE